MGGLLAPVGFVLGKMTRFNALLMAKGQEGARACYDMLSLWVGSFSAGGARRRRQHSQRLYDPIELQIFTLRPLCRELGVEVGWLGAYLHAMLTPVEILLTMAVITSVVKGKSIVDSLYYGMVTMTVRRRTRRMGGRIPATQACPLLPV